MCALFSDFEPNYIYIYKRSNSKDILFNYLQLSLIIACNKVDMTSDSLEEKNLLELDTLSSGFIGVYVICC